MFWTWLRKFVVLLLKLLVPPPPPAALPQQIDVNARCPVCGHCDGEIKATWENPVLVIDGAIKLGTVYVEHLCHVCKGRWFVPMLDAAMYKEKKVIAHGT